MAGFIRRFQVFPPLDVITEIEGVVIVDQAPPSIFVGLQTGTVLSVGEWPGGPFNTPTVVEGDRTIDAFGGFSISLRNPLAPSVNPFSDGNAFCWLRGKAFRKLVLARVDLTTGVGFVTLTLSDATAGTQLLTQDLVIPAGTRVRNPGVPTQEFALAQSVTFKSGVDLDAAGPPTTAWTALSVDGNAIAPQFAKSLTRQVTGVPVYSVQNLTAALTVVTQIDSGDLFRAGIGAGASLFPTVSVAVVNPAALLPTPWTLASIETAYSNTINSTNPGEEATDDVTIIALARTSDVLRTTLRSHVADASAVGRGRVGLVRPPIGTLPATAKGSAAPGVGATRSDRIFYCYPHFEQRIPEIAAIDPTALISSPNILLGADSLMAMLLSQLAPENNPGQSTQEFVSGGYLSMVRALESGLTGVGPTKFTLTDYKQFKAAGLAVLRRSSEIAEWVFQSGVTSVDPVLYPNLAPISRRMMADFIEDSAASIALKYNKKPATASRFDSLVGDQVGFLDTLLSATNPERQRINAYSIDTKSGNTKALAGSGIKVIKEKVQLLDSLDYIVLQTEIGATVTFEAFEDPVTAG